jgi:hypothetical protein
MFSSNTTQVSDGGYQISRSLRFNSADSAYLNRTPASASNRRTWTFSAWVKLSALTGNNILFSASNGSTTQFYINFGSTNVLDIVDYSGSTQLQRTTTQVLRDPSAFYHLVVVLDTTQASASNRFKLYINGAEVTAFSTSITPSQNYDGAVNSTDPHAFGRDEYADNNYYSGYLTETYLIDGQALTPSSFGETNADTGVWTPKAYSGSYGTNGFKLNFSDNSNTTAATLGADSSGNGNNWTPNNFSVTAGVGNDSLIDTPTPYGVDTGVGGSVRGNYCTMNPLSTGSYVTLSDGNLRIVGNTATDSGVALSTIGVTTGFWYWETTCVATGGLSYAGFGKLNSGYSSLNNAEAFLASYGGGYRNGGQIYGADRQITTTSTFGDGDIIGIALDMTNGAAYLSKNGTFLNSGVPTSGSSKTGAVWAWTPSSMTYAICPAGGGYNNSSNYLNLGQRAFAYTAPSGFKALCTQNLPTPTIGATTATQAGKYFNPVLYTGNSTADRSVTGVGFQPDFVWLKARNAAGQYHNIVDSVRGATGSVMNTLYTNTDFAEATTNSVNYTNYGLIKSINSDGFTVTTGVNGYDQVNFSGSNYVAWNWKANGSGSSNTSGSVTSTVSANTTSGFSVVTYTGTGANATVGHGIGIAPSMVIVKQRNTTRSWIVYNINLGATKYIVLDSTGAAATYSLFWNDTAPTSTVFSIGTDGAVNTSAGTYVAYCFAEVAGYSKFGSYTGNGSTDGAFVFTGMRPAFVMLKASSTGGAGYNWGMFDNDRLGYNSAQRDLRANVADAEGTDNNLIDFLSNGFKIRSTSGGFGGGSGVTYIYMAFADNPFKYSLAR